MDASLTSSLGRGLILPDKSSYMDSEVECKPNEDVISCTFRFLDEGEKKIKLDVNHKDSIMLLGNTGSGKTTFAQFIAGDNTKLISKETEEGSGEYIIIGDGISNSTFRSETVFPKLVIDSKRNAAFYDCPGFSDTEGTSNEIAETYFIKRVLDFLESLKMVFVINYSSVKRGNDRQDFMKFLRHATDLVKDIEKYKNSFVMVATKVENTYIRKEGDLVLVDDDKVIASIAGFLKETKQYLEDKSKINNLSEKKKRFYENALKLVEILLEKEGKNYPKIGIFRAPDRPGPVSGIPLLQTAKQYIEKIVHEKLAFSAKNNGDFGYTLSDRTKIDISEIVKEINKKLAAKLSMISEKIQDYCKTLVEQITRKIELIASSVNFVDADPSEAEKLRYKFISAYNSTSELISKMANLTNSEELSGLVKTTTSILKIDIPKSEFLYLETQGKYFNFLQTVSDRPLSSKHWNLLFKDVKVFLSGSKTIILKDVDDAAKSIRDKIKNELNDTINVIKDEYTKKLKILEIKKMPDTLNRDYKFILQLVSKLKNKTTEELVKAIDYVTENLKINVPKENYQNIKNQVKYLEFLGKLSNMPLNILSMTWLDPFLDLGQYFHESGKWYSFLEDLYNKFSEYGIQKDRQMYNVENLEDWGHPGKSQGIYVTPKTFSKFLDKIRNLNVAEYETVEKLSKISDLQIEELNEALSLTLRHRPTVRCSGPHITVEGTFIVLEDIMNSLKTNLDTNNGCNNFESMLKADKYDLFKVFSLNRVFIDTDLSFSGNRISVAVIAPQWEVVGSRSIDLSGSEGAPPKEPKAKNSTRQRENGTNGVPGNPGVTGETFFGIGTSFVGGTNLKIISYGGRGGPGQDGGDGGPGAPGRDGLKPVEGDHQLCNSNENYRGFKCELVSHVWKGWSAYYINTYKVHGEPGGRGARGGDGGKGGKGGHPGNIRIIELSQPSEIRNITTVENEGKNGSGGSGGEGGKHGDDIIAALRVSPPMGRFQPHYNYKWTEINTEQNNSKGPSGERGKDGANIAGQKDAVPAKGVGSVPTMINEYKIYLRENMNSRFTKSSLLRFLDELDKSDKVNNAYDILAFIEEFKGIEEQYPNLKNQMDFSVFYNSLLDRIGEFAKHLKKGEPLKENKKVLNYLYTATLARLRNLRERSETGLIIDIRKYMNLIQDNIKTLKDLETQSNKVEVVNRYKESYKKGIDKKIQEATSFIENTVSPEIDKINANIDDQVDTLIEEVIELQKEAKEEIQKLEEKKKELEKTLALKGFFGCLQLIGGVVKFLGPMGKIAGAVMDAANSVGDALILDDQETPIELPKDIASSIDTIAGKIKKMRNKKADILQKSLDNLSEEIEKNPDKLGDMKDKINDIKEKLKKSTENKLDYEQVKTLTNDLNKELERKGIDLKSNPKDKKSKSALEVIEKIEKVGEYGSLLLDVYDKYKKEEGKIKEVDDSIKDLQDKLKDLREYEDSIYETTVPMLNEMLKHMKDINEKMGTKSQVALDVTKWQVQSNLKDMRREMQKLTKGFSVQDDISRSIEKLEEVMTTLITIYDRIQSYQDQEKLADYIGDISSVAASRINIKNQKLVNAVNYLEYEIRANIVLEEYKSALNALKQWVFPFSDRYIERSLLPPQIELEKNIENLVQNATSQIEAIKQKIDLYDASVKDGDEYLECEEFSSRYVSTRPFFVWKNEEFGSLISDLLSGKEVVLKADVKLSSPFRDAIKFSEVDFDFRTKNETTQSSLSEVLKGFDVRATHFGNSYYRYEEKIYLIVSDSVTISYSNEQNQDGVPVRSNSVYNKLRVGDLLLSPYTLWKISLVDRSANYSFKDLENFKNQADLELSGLGSFVDSFKPTSKSIPQSININCKFKNRLKRSFNEIVLDGGYMTNDSPKGMSSPINLVFNFLKNILVSKALASINHIFIGEQRRYLKVSDDFPNDPTGTRSIGRTDKPNLTMTKTVKTDIDSLGNCCMKERIFSANTNNSLRYILLNDQEDISVQNHCLQVPDLNCSLLLADVMTRTITGNKYKPAVAECLLSPREVVLEKIREGFMQSESEVKQMLHLQQTQQEKGGRKLTSWYDTLNGYAKSLFTYLGLLRYETVEYEQDIRHLFA